ncbi:MAG: hypothetical protein MMC33_006554 [Icmadophila ericetorum]|nr:hypothetical protein [Icmadophila ericetorum]
MRTYSFDRKSVLSGNFFYGVIENHPCWSAGPLPPRSLRALKQASSTPSVLSTPDTQQINSDQANGISTHDAAISLIWRSIMPARHRAGILSDCATKRYPPFKPLATANLDRQ